MPHTEEDTFEDLFSQFDDLADRDQPPVAVPNPGLTRSRALGLLERLARWVLQGPGVLVIYLSLIVALIGRPNELVINALGVGLATFLLSPLLGNRPIKQPGRWAAVALVGLITMTAPLTVGRWPTMLADRSFAPVSALVIAGCDILERTTSPSFLLALAAAAASLLWLAGRLALRQPWVETRRKSSPWRSYFSLSLGGLTLGLVLAVQVGHHALWSQDWLTRWNHPPTSVDGMKGDLADIFLGSKHRAADYSKMLSNLPKDQLGLAAASGTAYLDKEQPLTGDDLRIIRALALVIAPQYRDSEPPSPLDPRLANFFWSTYLRAYRSEIPDAFTNGQRRVLRQRLLVEFCRSENTPQTRDLWKKRLDSLVTPKPVNPKGVDDLFLDRLWHYRPGFPSGSQADQPLKLFGIETRVSPGVLADHAEKSLALLVYSQRRSSTGQLESPRPEEMAPPYTHLGWVDAPIQRLLGSLLLDTPSYKFDADQRLILTLITLKEQAAKTGLYPTDPALEPGDLRYESLGKSARISANRVGSNDLYFESELR